MATTNVTMYVNNGESRSAFSVDLTAYCRDETAVDALVDEVVARVKRAYREPEPK